jgi:AraC-like DNA-binding protein
MPIFMEHCFQCKTTDPEELQENLLQIVGPFQARPASGSSFHVNVSVNSLNNIGLFTVKARSLNVRIEPPLSFFGINLPLGNPFSIIETNRRSDFHDDVHLVAPDRTMALEAASGCRVLAVSMDKEAIRNYASKLYLSDRPLESGMQTRLCMASPSGYRLVRSLAKLWSELKPDAHGQGSRLHSREIEDEVIANFVLAASPAGVDCDQNHTLPTPCRVALAEDYLCEHLRLPVSRANLAEVSSVSIRTLSRGFMQRHGMGPMQFLKARRLEAAYRDLLGSEPGATSVTEVASRYGFNHFGKFAIEYKRTFRESPSRTLHG